MFRSGMRTVSTVLALFTIFVVSSAARAKNRVLASVGPVECPSFVQPAGSPVGASPRSPGLPAGAGGAISRAIGADQAGYFARETAQGYRLDHGAITLALSEHAARVMSDGKALTLRLTGYGRGGSVQDLPPVSPRAHANRVEYDRDGLIEWYASGPAGIEQGFTIARSPAGTGRLRLVMTVSGEVVAAMDADGQAASFRVGGKPWLRYAGLSAFDARGRELAARLDLSGNRLSIEVHDSGAAYPVTVDPYFQEARLTASDGAANDRLGYSVAISGDTVAAVTPYAKIGSNAYQGAAYVFVKPAGGWASTSTFDAKLTASDGLAYDQLGWSVAISGDTVVVGASQATVGSKFYQGKAYVFVEPGSGWTSATETARLTASDGVASDQLGSSVAISGDAVVAGATGWNSGRGAAYVFVKPAAGWSSTSTFDAKLAASDGAASDNFGYSVAISGDTVVATTPYAKIGSNSEQGAAYVFVEPGAGWTSATETAKLTASDGIANDNFGYSVSIDGDTVVSGAPNADIGSNFDQGAAYVFVKPGIGGWVSTSTFEAKLTASDGAANDRLGYSVAISGDTVVAGAPNTTIVELIWGQGAAYVFVKPAAGWSSTSTFDAKLTASDGAAWDALGYSIAISGDTVVAGALFADIGSNSGQGALYVFGRGPCTASTTAVTNASTPSGVPVDLTATVTSSSTVNSGTVTFSVDGVEVGTASVVSGTATLLVANQILSSTPGVYPLLVLGGYTIRADYGGTGDFCASTNTGTLTVVSCTATTTAVSNASMEYDPVDLTATVSATSTVNGGTVTFSIVDTGDVLGSASVVNGTATLTVANQTLSSTLGHYPDLAEGNYTIKADYSGSASFCASSNTGTLTVSWEVVTAPREIKQGVLSDLQAIRATVTDRGDRGKLDDAIRHLTKSLDPRNWIDDLHVRKGHAGESVFNEEKPAADRLRDLIRRNRSGLTSGQLQPLIDSLIAADRALAQTAIDDAIAAAGKPADIKRAQAELARGDASASAGRHDAIDHYKNAWKAVMH